MTNFVIIDLPQAPWILTVYAGICSLFLNPSDIQPTYIKASCHNPSNGTVEAFYDSLCTSTAGMFSSGRTDTSQCRADSPLGSRISLNGYKNDGICGKTAAGFVDFPNDGFCFTNAMFGTFEGFVAAFPSTRSFRYDTTDCGIIASHYKSNDCSGSVSNRVEIVSPICDAKLLSSLNSVYVQGETYGCERKNVTRNGRHLLAGRPVLSHAPTDVPTLSPTSAPVSQAIVGIPSNSPSDVPTLEPTAIPSVVPTLSPTDVPTSAPVTPSRSTARPTTQSPTVKPSSFPTSSPPSSSPSRTPSSVPTSAPTAAPSTPNPTSVPTSAPTDSPSTVPSASPSGDPSSTPSLSPTNIPSASPSRSPSFSPSVSPSIIPSAVPSMIPSLIPTASPTSIPSYSPTSAPITRNPTRTGQTYAPTAPPSVTPSFIPSINPSASPSSTPSFLPSGSPTHTPSIAPSYAPITAEPTSTPSAAPSLGPSSAPSAAPTFTLSPTLTPTLSPSNTPSSVPSLAPSTSPTFPTHAPSSVPSDAPSGFPTSVPSSSPTEFFNDPFPTVRLVFEMAPMSTFACDEMSGTGSEFACDIERFRRWDSGVDRQVNMWFDIKYALYNNSFLPIANRQNFGVWWWWWYRHSTFTLDWRTVASVTDMIYEFRMPRGATMTFGSGVTGAYSYGYLNYVLQRCLQACYDYSFAYSSEHASASVQLEHGGAVVRTISTQRANYLIPLDQTLLHTSITFDKIVVRIQALKNLLIQSPRYSSRNCVRDCLIENRFRQVTMRVYGFNHSNLLNNLPVSKHTRICYSGQAGGTHSAEARSIYEGIKVSRMCNSNEDACLTFSQSWRGFNARIQGGCVSKSICQQVCPNGAQSCKDVTTFNKPANTRFSWFLNFYQIGGSCCTTDHCNAQIPQPIPLASETRPAHKCQIWYNQQPPEDFFLLHTNRWFPNCPPQLFQAQADPRFVQIVDSFHILFPNRYTASTTVASAEYFYYITTWPRWPWGVSLSCSYEKGFGGLVPNGFAAGHYMFGHPFWARAKWIQTEGNPRLWCCVESNQCQLFYQRRPSDTGQRYIPPRFGCACGDPHITFLDGGMYTFNGVGEYVMGKSIDGRIEMQTRTEKASPTAMGSVFTAFVLRVNSTTDDPNAQGNFDTGDNIVPNNTNNSLPAAGTLSIQTVQIEINFDNSTWINEPFFIYIGCERGTIITNTSKLAVDWNNVTLDLAAQDTRGVLNASVVLHSDDVLTVSAISLSRLSIETSVGASMVILLSEPSAAEQTLGVIRSMNFEFALSESFNNTMEGLLGNFNNKSADDFVMRNGTVLSPSPTPDEIHTFGQSWQVLTNDTLFCYHPGQDLTSFEDPAFTGNPTANFSACPNATVLATRANVTCRGNLECLYDVAATCELGVGAATLNVSVDIQTKQEVLNTVLTCVPACVHGACQPNGTCLCPLVWGGPDCNESIAVFVPTLTDGPTSVPSFGPTTSPTKAPSSSPTTVPSASPSSIPTAIPSVNPSSSPTRGPTSPTFSPSPGPTKNPTFTRAPSRTPSSAPSANPTISLSPTHGPSIQPTFIPTIVPTVIPTDAPSFAPSVIPSSSPSSSPSVSPSALPTTSPSGMPTAMPSFSPSRTPSQVPSGVPSSSPSSVPSGVPSSVPSSFPTDRPMTATPTLSPTKNPTTHNALNENFTLELVGTSGELTAANLRTNALIRGRFEAVIEGTLEVFLRMPMGLFVVAITHADNQPIVRRRLTPSSRMFSIRSRITMLGNSSVDAAILNNIRNAFPNETYLGSLNSSLSTEFNQTQLGVELFRGLSSTESQNGHDSGPIVAIVFGTVCGVGFLVVVLYPKTCKEETDEEDSRKELERHLVPNEAQEEREEVEVEMVTPMRATQQSASTVRGPPRESDIHLVLDSMPVSNDGPRPATAGGTDDGFLD